MDRVEQTDSGAVVELDPSTPWRLHPSVATRREPFGGLLYHYGTRRLTFVKDPALVRVLEALAEASSVNAALTACRIAPDAWPGYTAALQRLAATDMLEPGENEIEERHR